MRNVLYLSALLAALALSGPATAQAPASAPPPAHHGILGRIFHRPGQPIASGAGVTPISGGIVGNKKSHVYHLPGDKGSLPSAQNRVYFRTEAQAVVAGYHKSGSVAVKSHTVIGGQRHKPLTPTMAPAH